MKKKTIVSGTIFFVLSFFALTPSSSAQTINVSQNHAAARLNPVNNSGVAGFVDLQQLRNQTGTKIGLVAFGLMAGHNYVSLYYSNHVCNLEPYSADDVIGGIYTANSVGVGVTHGTATDNLSDINSVSVRDADNFHLLACANIHPKK